jgi:enamine deaminase RidA (YjgF/YER057c/UK114 family)
VRYRHINPEELGIPSGWSHGMLAPPGGRLLFVAGQDASGAEGHVETDDFVEQFGIALRKGMTVVRAAGGKAHDVGRITIFVADVAEYRAARKALGPVYRGIMGRHFPAMALVEVAGLVEERAKVEMEITAIIPDEEPA